MTVFLWTISDPMKIKKRPRWWVVNHLKMVIYGRFRILSPPLMKITSYKVRKSAGPNPLHTVEVSWYWITSHTVLNLNLHNIPVQKCFLDSVDSRKISQRVICPTQESPWSKSKLFDCHCHVNEDQSLGSLWRYAWRCACYPIDGASFSHSLFLTPLFFDIKTELTKPDINRRVHCSKRTSSVVILP